MNKILLTAILMTAVIGLVAQPPTADAYGNNPPKITKSIDFSANAQVCNLLGTTWLLIQQDSKNEMFVQINVPSVKTNCSDGREAQAGKLTYITFNIGEVNGTHCPSSLLVANHHYTPINNCVVLKTGHHYETTVKLIYTVMGIDVPVYIHNTFTSP